MKRPMIWAVVPYMLGIAVADTGWFPFWLPSPPASHCRRWPTR